MAGAPHPGGPAPHTGPAPRTGPAETVDTQVIVVGAGPVGLLLAGELALRGIRVTLVERRHGPTTESRASTLHARTMELLDSRGLLADLGSPPREPRGHFGGIPLDLTLPGPYPGQWKVPQARTESVLEEWALGLGADLRCGHTLHAVDDRGTHVEAAATGRHGDPLTLRAPYLVACDGQDSTVRRLTGAPFPGTPAARELLRADVEGVDIPNRRFERLPGGFAVAARNPAGVTRVMVHEFGAAVRARAGDPHFDEVTAAWKRVTGEDITGGTPLWVNRFDDENRLLARYRHGRVLFAGDAAHRQMPIGGQALNLGLQDAHNLGWKLAAAVDGTAPDGLLDSYDTERSAVGAAVLGNIRAQAMLLLGGPEVEPLRTVLAELLAHDTVRTRLAAMISGLDIRYDVGGPAHPLSGARLPHLRLRTGEMICSAAELLRSGRGLLLGLGAPPPPIAAGLADRVDTVTAHAAADEPLEGAPAAVLVRPDGHVAWAGGADGDGDGLGRAVARWFGSP
ncbi:MULTISPECIES: FAD-dependent oxidoreductase [Streptomyces]|uniref:FAD-dependent oxidoreductase n=1 Tax=Streptomyces TaxID=1883 RepID=UPI0013DC8AAE|nr:MULTISPECIES: FAD-dependent oxidoreductase [Streptomyces]KAF2774767.1 monooxygenase FAD-binding protein [Streptomyces sp. OM5714]MDI6521281.1 FAD-dependent monooxygenase [Streptomyces coelicoflavus]